MPEFTENDVAKIMGLTGEKPATQTAASTESNAAAAQGAAGTEGAAATQQGAAAAGAGAPPATGAAAGTAGAAAAQGAAPAFDLSKVAGGRFKTIEDLDAEISRAQALETQLNEAKAQPKFASDRHKRLYDLTSKFETDDAALDALHQEISIARLDVPNLADHQARLEAFKLRPENKGLTREKLEVLFADEELSKFGDSTQENGQTPAQKIRAEQATIDARNQLNQKKQEFLNAKTAVKSPDQLASERAAYQADVREQLKDFDGVELNVSGLDETTQKKFESKVNFKLDPNQKHLDKVIQMVSDPQGWWANYLQENGVLAKDGSGKVDLKAFGRIATTLQFLPEIQNLVYKQGRADMVADDLKTRRNADGTPAEVQTSTTQTVKKTDKEEMVAGALKSIGFPGA